MNLKEKVKWRFKYAKENGFRAIPLVLPGRIRALFYGRYSFLSWLASQDKELKIKKEKNRGYLITFRDFKFLVPPRGFVEIDFLDIVYPPEKLAELKSRLPAGVLDDEGPYETDQVFLRKNDIVIDAGANVGLFSIYAAKKVGKGGKVFAFEPVPEIVRFLSENVSINGCPNVFINESALGRATGPIALSVNLRKVFEGSSSVINRGGEKRIVPQTTVDDFVVKNKLEKVDFIKADIEGAERDMIFGAEKTIKRFRPNISVRTYHLPDDPAIIEKAIRNFVPEYSIQKKEKTIYARI